MAVVGGNVTGGRVAVVSIFDSNCLFKILVSALKNRAEILAFCFVHFESNLAVSQLLECAIPPALLSVTKKSESIFILLYFSKLDQLDLLKASNSISQNTVFLKTRSTGFGECF